MDVLSSYSASGMTPYNSSARPTLSPENPVLESVVAVLLLTALPLAHPGSSHLGQNLDVYA